MRTSFHPRLINDPFGDPGLFISFLFEKKALLFDLGELTNISSRDLLKISHVFVTHAHMDHFIGFDSLLRLFLGRNKNLHIFGPPDFFNRLEGKLNAYTWNLVNEYENDFRIIATELHPSFTFKKEYVCRHGFRAKQIEKHPFSGILFKDASFHIEGVLLDHRTPCLGLSLIERFHVNIIKQGLLNLGLPMGPWINRFKQALYEQKPLDEAFEITWEDAGTPKAKKFKFGELTEKIAIISPGQKIVYITDVIGSDTNKEIIINFAKNATQLFIEAAFIEQHKEIAKQKYHLTAQEAGDIAGKAAVKKMSVFHFSPRYIHAEKAVRDEAMAAFMKR